jgi:molybdate transport system substrate-binding protein
MKKWRAPSATALIVALIVGSAACSPASPSGTPSTTITIGAASSLTDVFATIADEFMAANPDITVNFSFAGSSAIAEQIRSGAPLDVFASAGTSSMDPVAAEGLVTDVTAFATNTLMIATPPGNPAGISGLADLSSATVLVCQEQVPCGVAAAALFRQNNLDISPVSFEPDVVSVLGKIEADEADAGIVYVTDVLSSGDRVEGVAIPAADNVTTTYQAAVVRDSVHADAAARFVAYLTAPQAQTVFAAAGFAPAS